MNNRSEPPLSKRSPARIGALRVLSSLLAHDEGVGRHVSKALVLGGDQHRYEGNQVAEQPVHDAQQRPYARTTKAGNLAVVLPYNLYPEHHLAHSLPQVPFQEYVVEDYYHPVEHTRKSRQRTAPVC